MTKVELVNAIAEKAELTKADAEKALKAVIDSITKALADGDKVALVGFGTFSVSERAARTGKNPQTGEKIQIQASRVPKFKAGKVLKDAVS
ncbi:MAG: HU family DNA-binding protein [Desulfuromonadaceae bacterium]|nr:HU family DNA-binding protein [Desulfuromonadaceae bacterium]